MEVLFRPLTRRRAPPPRAGSRPRHEGDMDATDLIMWTYTAADIADWLDAETDKHWQPHDDGLIRVQCRLEFLSGDTGPVSGRNDAAAHEAVPIAERNCHKARLSGWRCTKLSRKGSGR